MYIKVWQRGKQRSYPSASRSLAANHGKYIHFQFRNATLSHHDSTICIHPRPKPKLFLSCRYYLCFFFLFLSYHSYQLSIQPYLLFLLLRLNYLFRKKKKNVSRPPMIYASCTSFPRLYLYHSAQSGILKIGFYYFGHSFPRLCSLPIIYICI